MEELRFVTLDEVPRYECFFLFPSSSLTVLSPRPRSIRESRRVPSRRLASCRPDIRIFLRASFPPDFEGKSVGGERRDPRCRLRSS